MKLVISWKVKLLLLLFVTIGAFAWHQYEVKTQVQVAVQQKVDELTTKYMQDTAKIQEDSFSTQINLQNKSNQIQKDKDAQIKSLDTRVRTLSNSLHNRPERPSENSSAISYNPGDAESQTGANGMQLSRSDAELLVWFAGQTQELQVELQACYQQYDITKSTLDAFKAKYQKQNPQEGP